jgi:hypothetical protein
MISGQSLLWCLILLKNKKVYNWGYRFHYSFDRSYIDSFTRFCFYCYIAGLAILATEFAWARRLLKKVKQQIKRNNMEAERKEKT